MSVEEKLIEKLNSLQDELNWLKESLGIVNNAVMYQGSKAQDNREKVDMCLEYLYSRPEFHDWYKARALLAGLDGGVDDS